MFEFGQNLARIRRSRNLTQLQLAELLRVQPRLVSRWETGESKPRFDYVVTLADVLEVSLDELVKGKEVESGRRFDIRNKRLEELCRQVDELGKQDQEVVCYVMDSLVRREQLQATSRGAVRTRHSGNG